MKRVMDNEYETRKIRESLELPAVPEIIDERLRQVYAELPEEVPVKRRSGAKRVWKTAVGTVSSLAAAFVLLLGLNGLNPALAESLPFLGGIFQQINNRQGWVNLDTTQNAVAQYATPIEGVEVQVPAGGILEKPMTVAVKEAYFDGEFLYAGLTMEIDSSASDLHAYTAPGYDILINGDGMLGVTLGHNEADSDYGRKAEGFARMGSPWYWQRSENGTYVSQVSFRVPERYHGLEQLDITLQYCGIQSRGAVMDSFVNSTSFDISFSVEKNEVQLKRIEGGVEVNGVKLVSAMASSAGSSYTLEFPPEIVNPATGAQFEDGGGVGALGDTQPQILEDGTVRITRVFGGLQENESRKVVYTVFDKNGSHEYEAVFILDFQNGTAEIGTVDDIVEFTPSSYTCPAEELENFSGQHKIAYVHQKENGNMLAIFAETKDIFSRAIGVEVWQDDTLLGARTEKWDLRDSPAWGRSYTFSLIGMEILDASKPVTIKLYDASSGEKMLEETITLTPDNN